MFYFTGKTARAYSPLALSINHLDLQLNLFFRHVAQTQLKKKKKFKTDQSPFCLQKFIVIKLRI